MIDLFTLLWSPTAKAVVSQVIRLHYTEATSAEASFRIHPRVNPWFSAKADKILSISVSDSFEILTKLSGKYLHIDKVIPYQAHLGPEFGVK